MRSSLLLIMAALLVPGLALAQTSSWGAAAGVADSGVRGELERFQERTTGAAFGLYAARRIREHLSVGVELWYSRTGVDFVMPDRGGPVPGAARTYSLRFQALELHALPRVELPSPFSWIRPTLMLGPALVWIPSCSYRQSYTNQRAQAGHWTGCAADPDLTPDSPGGPMVEWFLGFPERRAFDVRAVSGLGLEVPLGPTLISVEARYTLGLRSMDGAGNPDARHEAVWALARVGWTP
ncbi:MAG TPA: hypothetical protein VMK65_12105 [Longimicrobiales bacterium]|nr:hypothetical protein [Longimicrobiales bacterium]